MIEASRDASLSSFQFEAATGFRDRLQQRAEQTSSCSRANFTMMQVTLLCEVDIENKHGEAVLVMLVDGRTVSVGWNPDAAA
jgi:hypothetical protein